MVVLLYVWGIIKVKFVFFLNLSVSVNINKLIFKLNEDERLKSKKRKIEPNGIKRTTCSPDPKNSHLFWLKGPRAFRWRREEAILGVPISPSFGVLLDQLKEGKKEDKEKKKKKARLKSFKRIKVRKLS